MVCFLSCDGFEQGLDPIVLTTFGERLVEQKGAPFGIYGGQDHGRWFGIRGRFTLLWDKEQFTLFGPRFGENLEITHPDLNEGVPMSLLLNGKLQKHFPNLFIFGSSRQITIALRRLFLLGNGDIKNIIERQILHGSPPTLWLQCTLAWAILLHYGASLFTLPVLPREEAFGTPVPRGSVVKPCSVKNAPSPCCFGKKNIKLLILLPLVLPGLAFAQTNVSGNQSGTWTSNNSPYQVIGHVTVPSGQTLNIEAGVEINFQGHYRFYVDGNLQAIGTEESMIVFTTDTPSTGWGGLRVETGDTILLEYCRIEHGSALGSEYPDFHGGALALLGSDATVRNCVFADNEAHDPVNELGMGGAVYAINTTATSFTDCVFIRNHCYGEGGAIKFSGGSDIEITNCEFVQNNCNYGGGAVACYSVSGTNLRGCTFVDNYTMYSNGGAIQTLGGGDILYFSNCTLTGNSAVTGEGGAVSLSYATAYFVNTIVYDNPGAWGDDVWVTALSPAEVYYSNMPMPDGATGHDNMNVDPEFVDAANYDFNLLETSPCIDAGVAYQESTGGAILVNLEPSQYEGAAPDIGAFEHSYEIFADGFETGDTSSWGVTTP